MWFTYIIKSIAKKWYYVGSTNRLEERLVEHNKGKVQSTKAFKPYVLFFTKTFITEKEARNFERKIKKCRKEKEAIIKSTKCKNY